jgi:ferritin-like metal-binding protein YciE
VAECTLIGTAARPNVIVPFQIERGIPGRYPACPRCERRLGRQDAEISSGNPMGDRMALSNLQEQLTKYLTDAHSIEQQALAQLKSAPKLAGDEHIAAIFAEHLVETEAHERSVAQRLAARDAKPSKVKDLVGTITGTGFTAFAGAQPDTPGKLVVHAFSYEHMEEAAYELVTRVAERAGDPETAELAREIERQERTMGGSLAACFDRAAQAALDHLDVADIQSQLDKYLADAHAIEAQGLQLLDKATNLAGSAELESAYSEHRAQSQEHQRRVAKRLEDRGAAPSKVKDAALRLGALNWGVFFAAQPDTPAKLAAFAYAFEHLEVGAYAMLERVAERAADGETQRLANEIVLDEQAAAERVWSLFDQALDASLSAQSVGAR